ncbi:MAG: putative acyl-CoA dehydrogenase [Acidimicrobiales bacterium]|nr:putative acyl-CoA dehydrogenase [Acidimicrobiales bacterium]
MTATTVAPTGRTQDRIWHDIGLPPGVAHVRAMVREAVATHLAPAAREMGQREEARDAFAWKPFRGLADAGVFALPFAEPFGPGLSHPLLATCIAAEEIAYESSSMAGVFDGQCLLVPQALSFASDELRAQVIPQLVSGEQAFAFATTEPDASSDLSVRSLSTTATPVGDGYLIRGRKRWITNSVVAGWAAVLCRDGDAATMVLVDMRADEVTVGEPDLKMGQRGQITADIVFDDVFVPFEHVLGDRGRGLPVALSTLTRGRIGIGAVGVGVAQAAMDLAVERLGARTAFGRKLGQMQHWQYRMAEHALQLESARLLYQKAAIRLDEGSPSAEPEASMAKILGSRLANDLARDAIQIHGGYGFARRVSATGETCRLEEIYRDAKILEIFEGANEVLLWVIARELLGRDLAG